MIEPVTIEEAMRLPEWCMWQRAIEKEVGDLVKMDTWDEVDESEPASKGRKILPSKFVLKIKLKDVAGQLVLDKVKARLTAGGHRSVAGRDHFETAAYMAMSKSVRSMLALAAGNDDEVVMWDISSAFLWSEMEEGEEVYMQLPKLLGQGGVEAPGEYTNCGVGRGRGKCAKLKRYLYGLPSSGRKFFRNLGSSL
jgi:hypothetical protein